jgi:predicted transcriptional regulator
VSAKLVSKLELYMTVLQALEESGSLTLLDLERRTELSQSILTLAMNFLKQHAYVKSTDNQENITYENTLKGNNVARYFSKSPQITNRCLQ